MQKRGILGVVLLMLFTCGFYSLYLTAALHQETSVELGKEASLGKNILLIFVTCGIWIYVLNYDTAKNYVAIGQQRGVVVTDNSVLTLLLSIFGLMIVSNAILQDQQNNLIG